MVSAWGIWGIPVGRRGEPCKGVRLAKQSFASFDPRAQGFAWDCRGGRIFCFNRPSSLRGYEVLDVERGDLLDIYLQALQHYKTDNLSRWM